MSPKKKQTNPGTMFASRLKKLQSTWDESKERAREMFTKVPPGVYLVGVYSADPNPLFRSELQRRFFV